MKARVSNLHKTENDWKRLNNWVPEAGELVIYDPDQQYSYARLKVGDGKKTLKELSFFIDSAVETMLQQHRFTEIIDGGRITAYKE